MNIHEQALADFLEGNPKAQKMQFMIDKRLKRCSNPLSRVILINEMMMDSVFKLQSALIEGRAAECKLLTLKAEKE